MASLLMVLSYVLGLGSLICFILVVVQMFKHGQTGLGVLTILLAFCGIGFLIAFIYGWIKASEWNIKNIMLAWTGIIIAGILLNIVAIATGAPVIPQDDLPI